MKTETSQEPKSRRERGGALLAVLGFALLALAFVLIAFSEADNQVRQVALEMRQQQSLAAGELGFSVAIRRLNLNQSPNFDGNLRAIQQASVDASGNSNDPSATLPPDLDVPPLFSDFADPETDRDGDGYADFEKADSFAEQKALFSARPSGSFAVRGIKIDDDTYKIRVFGVHDGDVRVLEAVIRRQASPILGGGAGFFGAEKLEIKQDGFLDSYVSGGSSPSVIAAGTTPQAYSPTTKEVVIGGVATGETETYAGSNVLVGSNERLEIKQDSKVIATTIIGEGGEITNEGTTYVPPTELPSPLDDTVPTYQVPAVNNNAELLPTLILDNNFLVPANSGYVLGQSGQDKTYVFDRFKTKKEASGTIRGNVTIFVNDEMKFDQSTVLVLEPGATLQIFTNSKVTFEKNLNVNNGGFPAAVQINSGVLTDDIAPPPDVPLPPDADPVPPDEDDDEDDDGDDEDDDDNLPAPGDIKLDIGGDPGAAFYGVIDAPGAKITIEKNANFFGGIRGRKVTLKEEGNFHYDESLVGFANLNQTSGRFVLTAFKEVR